MTRKRHTAASRSNALRCDGSFIANFSYPKIKSQNYKAFPDKHNNSTNCDNRRKAPNDAQASYRRVEERHPMARRKFFIASLLPKKIKSQNCTAFPDKHSNSTNCDKKAKPCYAKWKLARCSDCHRENNFLEFQSAGFCFCRANIHRAKCSCHIPNAR